MLIKFPNSYGLIFDEKKILESFKDNNLRDLKLIFDLEKSMLIFFKINFSIFESTFSLDMQLILLII